MKALAARVQVVGLCCGLGLSGWACSSKAAAEFLISADEENALGMRLKGELEKGTPATANMPAMPPVKYLAAGELRTYILGLASKVVELGKKEQPAFTWSVEVIDDPKQVNAFATPGGYLYVFTGLLAAADNEAEVVGVMGHEVGHVLARHFARRLVQTYTLQGAIAIALGDNPNVLTELAASLAAQGYLLQHSRGDETEADEYGARLTSQAGYDPNGLVTFFKKLELMQGQVPSILKYLMGHPPPGDRQVHIMELIQREKLPIGVTNADAFRTMKAKLPALPMMGADGGA